MSDNIFKGYEEKAEYVFKPGKPKVIRLDMVCGHSFTKGFDKPYDKVFRESMGATMKYLCGEIEGAVIGYTQSDEISIIVNDISFKGNYSPYYSNRCQKIASITASKATLYFANIFKEKAEQTEEPERYLKKLANVCFDSRVCELENEAEIVDYLKWRLSDNHRNAVQMLGRTYISHKQLQGKSNEEVEDMLQVQGIYMRDYPESFQEGVACVKMIQPKQAVNLHTGEQIICDRRVWHYISATYLYDAKFVKKQWERDYLRLDSE